MLVFGWLLLERGGCDAGEALVSVEGEGSRGISFSVLIGGSHGDAALSQGWCAKDGAAAGGGALGRGWRKEGDDDAMQSCAVQTRSQCNT